MKNGLFITFEGPDGSGKTSVVVAKVSYLIKKNIFLAEYVKKLINKNVINEKSRICFK